MFNLHNRLSGVQVFLARLSLQTRFLLVIGTAALCFALVVWVVFNGVTGRLVERLGARFAEKQVLYDKARTLQPLIRDVALARQMADNTLIKQWAANERNPQLRRQTLAEMEKFRLRFYGGSYFLALTKSGHYYFNDASGQYEGRQLRYTLDPSMPENAWFYATIKSGEDYHINVDPDTNLGVTKVWINVLLRDGDKVLGVLGTGVDLTEFIRNVADAPQPGVANLFVDRNAVIQAYHDIRFDFSSIAQPSGQRHSIDNLLNNPEDRTWIRQAISQLANGGSTVGTKLVHLNGKRYLAGVAALPEVGWYDITLLDLSVILPQHEFFEMGLAIGGAALGLLLILAFTLHRLVLRPVSVLTDAAARIRRGDYTPASIKEGSVEAGQLSAQFQVMADAVYMTHSWLEVEIEKRTHQLADAQKMLELSLRQEKDGRETQANLLALMAHEIRNPVAVIGNTAQMLNVLVQSDRPDWQPRIEKIMGAVQLISLLMDNFFAEDRINAKSSGLVRQKGDLNVFCAELATTLSARYGRPIRNESWSGDAMLWADWQLIRIAINNLIDNAIKYSPPDGDIRLRVLQVKAGILCVEVTDQGEGISPELQQSIFEKFIRGTDKSVPGTGIGLYLVNWIARFHGGYADVSSTKGEGNTFRFYLRLRERARG